MSRACSRVNSCFNRFTAGDERHVGYSESELSFVVKCNKPEKERRNKSVHAASAAHKLHLVCVLNELQVVHHKSESWAAVSEGGGGGGFSWSEANHKLPPQISAEVLLLVPHLLSASLGCSHLISVCSVWNDSSSQSSELTERQLSWSRAEMQNWVPVKINFMVWI